MMDLRQGESYAQYQELGGWRVSKIKDRNGKDVQVFVKDLPGINVSVLKGQRFKERLDWKSLRSFKKKNKVVYTVLEPLSGRKEIYLKEGYQINKNSYLPTKTIIVKLDKRKDSLWNDLSNDARKIIGDSKAVIRKLEGESERNKFWKKWNKTSKIIVPRWKRFQNLKESFGQNMRLTGAFVNEEMVAGTVVLTCEKSAYYYYAWTSLKGREMGGQYKLVWENIIDLKKKGVKYFDLEGIEDERWPRKSWRGFSLFKKKFGGKKVSYPGSFSKWF